MAIKHCVGIVIIIIINYLLKDSMINI